MSSDRMGIRKWLQNICLPVLLMFTATGGLAASKGVVKPINTLATAAIQDGNLAEGRQNAVSDALVAAVGRVIVESLSTETVVRRFKIVHDNMLAQPDKYVRNYRVLTESVSGTTISVLVQVEVATDRVSRDLSALGLARAGTVYPKVLFMVAEKNVGDVEFTYWWGDRKLSQRTISEGAMSAILRDEGFEMVAPSESNTSPGMTVNVSSEEMVALAGELGADVVIAGYAVATALSKTTSGATPSVEAAIDVQALNVRNGEPIGRTRQTTTITAKDEIKAGRDALAGAGASAGDMLARQVLAAWQRDQDLGESIEVVVEGTSGQIASFVRLRTTISSLSGVKELRMKGMRANQATMAVNYQGSARSLADALSLETFSGFGIDIVEVTSQAIHIRLKHQ